MSKMKKVLMLALLQCLFSTVFSQRSKGRVTSIIERSSFAQINKAGDLMKFTGLCTKCADSIHNGIINYKKATVVNIRDCKVSFTIVGNTLSKYDLEAMNQENAKALMELTFKTFGPPVNLATMTANRCILLVLLS